MVFVPEGQRDSSQARSAWVGVWAFQRAKLTARLGELGLLVLNVIPRPEGSEELSPGFTLGFWFNARGPEGAPADEAPRKYPEMAVAPSGLPTLGCVSQAKPLAKLSWPVGPKT